MLKDLELVDLNADTTECVAKFNVLVREVVPKCFLATNHAHWEVKHILFFILPQLFWAFDGLGGDIFRERPFRETLLSFSEMMTIGFFLFPCACGSSFRLLECRLSLRGHVSNAAYVLGIFIGAVVVLISCVSVVFQITWEAKNGSDVALVLLALENCVFAVATWMFF